MSTSNPASKFPTIKDALLTLSPRDRRKHLVALCGGQMRLARRAGVNKSTICRIVAGWDGGVAAAKAEGIIRHSLRKISPELVELWAA